MIDVYELEQSTEINTKDSYIISYPEFTNEDIQNYVNKALKEFYLNPGYISIALKNILKKDGVDELKGMISSANTFFHYLRHNGEHHGK